MSLRKALSEIRIDPAEYAANDTEAPIDYTREQIAFFIDRLCPPDMHYPELIKALGKLSARCGIHPDAMRDNADLFTPFISPDSETLADGVEGAIEPFARSFGEQCGSAIIYTHPDHDFAAPWVEPAAHEILSRYNHLRITDQSNIPEPVPVISIGGQTISTAQNITLLSGHAKTGKSAFLQPVLASSVCGSILDPMEGLEVKQSPGKAVIFIDTEQAEYKQLRTLKAIRTRAQIKSLPDYFLAYNFRKIETLPAARKALIEIADAAADLFGGVHLVAVDGIADLIADVNSPEESAQIVKLFELLAVRHNCPILTVLHLNPGSEAKERGHLGSHLQRKAESVLRVSTKNDVSCLEPAFLRNAGKARFPLIQFEYDPLKGYHVFAGRKEKTDSPNFPKLKDWAVRCFEGGGEKTKTDFIRALAEITGLGVRSCENFIREMSAFGIVEKTKSEGGREVFYRLLET